MQAIIPDYHFLYLAKDLGVDWFLVAGRKYWQAYRPIVTGDLDLVGYVYRDSTPIIAITSLARRDLAAPVASLIAERFPLAYHDPLVYDFVAEMQLTLDGRADYRQRFGVPNPPTPTALPVTPTPNATPTYGALIIRPPNPSTPMP